MPAAIAAAVTAAGVTGSIAIASAAGPALISYATIIGYGATLVASIGYSSFARRRLQRAANASLQDRMVPVRSSDAARTIVYGETRVAGALVYAATHGTKREQLSMVYALAGHPISSVESVWLNDAAVSLDGSDNVTTAPWAQSVELPYSEDWTAGGNGSSITLATSDTLLAVDSVAIWSDGDTGGEGYAAGRVSAALTSGYTVNLGTKTITLTTGDYAGLSLTATCRVSRTTSYVQVKRFLGTVAGERDTALEAATAADSAPWTSAHVGKGVPRLRCTLTWNGSAFANGIPTPTAVVRGRTVYDPRADSTNGGDGAQRVADPTTWAWSRVVNGETIEQGRNPALCAADYLMSDLGFGIASSRIDWPSVITAANVCDELVPIDASTGTQRRYTCDGVLSTDATRKANLEAILACMIGSAYLSAGKWYIRAAAYVVPDLDLDESDLSSDAISVQARAPRADLFNAVRGRYRDPSSLYQVVDFPPYASATYASEDGQTIFEDIELGLVNDARRAQRIAKLILYRHRQALTITAGFKLNALILQPGDTCRLTLARYGWTNKVFRVVACELADAASVRLTLQEEASAIYGWSYTEATNPDPAPNTSLPSPSFVPAPVNVVVVYSATSYIVRSDGTALPYVDLTWDAPPPDVQPVLYWKRAAETEYAELRLAVSATTGRIEGVSGGESLNIHIVNEAATGARSAIYWIAQFIVHPDLPGNGAPIAALSANLLRNASFVSGAEQWGSAVSDGTFFATVSKETSYPLVGVPSNGRLQIMSTATGTGRIAIALSAVVPVEPGSRYVGFADLIGWAVDGFIAIQWLIDSAGAGQAAENVNGNIIAAVVTESSTARPDRLDHYSRSIAFGVAPANARYARLLIAAGGTWLASDVNGAKYLFFVRPFFGSIPEGVLEAPPWDAGGAPVSSTDDLAIGAATAVYRSGSSSATFSFPAIVPPKGGGSLYSAVLQGPAFTATTSGTIEVSVVASINLSAPSENAVFLRAQFVSAADTWPASADWQDVVIADVSTTRIEQRTMTATFDVVAGQQVDVRLFLYRGGVTSYGTGGITEKTVSQVFIATDRFYDARWRVTYIKR